MSDSVADIVGTVDDPLIEARQLVEGAATGVSPCGSSVVSRFACSVPTFPPGSGAIRTSTSVASRKADRA